MGRIKPSTASPTFTAHPHRLSDAARDTLLDALGFDPKLREDRDAGHIAILDVQVALGAYPEVVKNVEGAPRASHYREAMKQIADAAGALADAVGELNRFIADALNEEMRRDGADVYAAEEALMNLRKAAVRVIARHGEGEGRGRPRGEGLALIVGTLCEIFDKHTRLLDDERTRFGSQSNLSDREASRLDFVGAALADADIKHPADLLAVMRAATRPP